MSKLYTLLITLAFLLPSISFAEPVSVNCNNYLNDNNLTVSVGPVKNNVSLRSGDTLDLNGTIVNKNNFPVGDVGVFIKIVRKQTDDSVKVNGLEVIDQLYPLQMNYIAEAKNGVRSTRNFSTVWKIPSTLPSGEYGVISYLTSNYRFNDGNFDLNTNQISYFSVENQVSGGELYLDRGQITLNDKKYSKGLVFDDNEPVKIKFTVRNVSSIKTEGTVYIKSYDGEINDSNNITKSNIEYISLEPNQSKEIAYNDYGSLRSKSKTVIELYFGDRKEIVNVDYNRNGYDKASIVSSGLNKFPIHGGFTVPLYVCYKTDNTNGLDLDVKVLDSNDSLIYAGSTKIDHSNYTKGVVFPVKFNQEYKDVRIITSIKNGSTTLDKNEVIMSCNQSEDGKCGGNSSMPSNGKPEATESERAIIISITLLLLVITTMYFLRHKKETTPAIEP